MRLLVVEDHAPTRRMMRATLRADGHTVLEAGDAAEALKTLASERVDVLLSDLLLPDMDGFRLCYQLRRDPRYAQMPIILLSGAYLTPGDADLAAAMGADRFLQKPIQAAVLAEALAAVAGAPRTGAPPEPGREAQLLLEYAASLEGKLLRRTADIEQVRHALVESNQELQRANERLAGANVELEAFASMASHDLQEPLRTVHGATADLQKRLGDHPDPLVKEDLAFALSATKHMHALIDDLLEYGRAGRDNIELRPTPLERVADEALALLAARLQDQGARIERAPLPEVRGDHRLLVQVFQNLVGNAAKFAGPAPPVVRLGAEPLAGNWRVTVADNGRGIDPDDITRLFTPFRRGRNAVGTPGTGIGLAICRRIVERHGGRIGVESTLGVGTRFHVTLPSVPGVPA